eukprot:5452026-Pyramimonas_sp.AAC.1
MGGACAEEGGKAEDERSEGHQNGKQRGGARKPGSAGLATPTGLQTRMASEKGLISSARASKQFG